MQGLFVTANNTNVGKTTVASHIITALNPLYNIVVRKPIETNCSKKNNILWPQDAIILNNSCKNKQDIDEICAYKFKRYASGELASYKHNITIDDLVEKCRSNNFVVVEGSGGFYSPIIKNKLNSDLAVALKLPIVLIIVDKIGAISEALLVIEAIKKKKLKIATVILNQIQDNSLANKENLQKYCNEKVITFNLNAINNFYYNIVKIFTHLI